jgi:cell fate regulator YaaT (PSP1 superfamily)
MNPVSIKMAKKQDLSLNSTKISGPCGRLLCCLSYEYPYYSDEKNRAPSVGTRITWEGEPCRVSEVNILSRKVRLTGESGRVLVLALEAFRYIPSEKRWVPASQEG